MPLLSPWIRLSMHSFGWCAVPPKKRLAVSRPQPRPPRAPQVRARCVALTVPAYTAAELVRRECPDAAAALKALDYPPVAAVTVAYPLSALRPDRLDASGQLQGAGHRRVCIPGSAEGVCGALGRLALAAVVEALCRPALQRRGAGAAAGMPPGAG